jgi:hypothetical protein
MEDSPTDFSDMWMTERNDDDPRLGKQWMQVYPQMVSVYPTYIWWRVTRTKMPTDCSSTVTQTM